MTTAYQLSYYTPTDFRVWEVENNRFVDPTGYLPYQDWLAAGGVPEHISGDRFIIIGPDGVPYWDPNKAAILAQEAYEATHPEPAMEETLRYACDMIDSIMLGGSKGASYFTYVRARWYTRDLTAAELDVLVQKRFITAAERTTILAVEQVPLSGG